MQNIYYLLKVSIYSHLLVSVTFEKVKVSAFISLPFSKKRVVFMFIMQAGRSKGKKGKKEKVERALTDEQIAGTFDYLISRLNQTDI